MMLAETKRAPEFRMDAVDTWKLCTELVGAMIKAGANQFQVAAAIHDTCYYMGWNPQQVLNAGEYATHVELAEVKTQCNSPGNLGMVGS